MLQVVGNFVWELAVGCLVNGLAALARASRVAALQAQRQGSKSMRHGRLQKQMRLHPLPTPAGSPPCTNTSNTSGCTCWDTWWHMLGLMPGLPQAIAGSRRHIQGLVHATAAPYQLHHTSLQL